jgi:phosphoglycerate dehydrogenase-like enzyme
MTAPPNVLLHNDKTDDLVRALGARFPEVQMQTCNSYNGLDAAVRAFRPDAVYSVRFDPGPGFPREALFHRGGPRWVANGGVGVDHFGSWDPDQVTVTNAAGVAAEMMAEYVLGGFLHFTLDVPGLQADKAARLWRARMVRPLKGRTLLIVGLGHTGQALATRARAFGMTVIGTRANPVSTKGVDEVHGPADLIGLLPRADFIAVATPLIPATRGLLSGDAFAAMKDGVILADVSRGGVVDQAALVKALGSGKVASAILDVFEEEPLPPSNPLWAVGNAILSPHCSSVYAEWEAQSFALFLDNLERFAAGQPLVNVVDPARGY